MHVSGYRKRLIFNVGTMGRNGNSGGIPNIGILKGITLIIGCMCIAAG